MNQVVAGQAIDVEHAHVTEQPRAAPQTHAHAEGQQHPIRIYLLIWALLFLFSVCSYLIDYFDLKGVLRWGLIITFMLLKAGFIVAIFMHMAWERLALKVAILLPPIALLVLIGLMAIEGDYTFVTRLAAYLH
jgi:cytochrome c oxidase subunit 4